MRYMRVKPSVSLSQLQFLSDQPVYKELPGSQIYRISTSLQIKWVWINNTLSNKRMCHPSNLSSTFRPLSTHGVMNRPESVYSWYMPRILIQRRPFSPTTSVGFSLVRPHSTDAGHLSWPFTNPLPAVMYCQASMLRWMACFNTPLESKGQSLAFITSWIHLLTRRNLSPCSEVTR